MYILMINIIHILHIGDILINGVKTLFLTTPLLIIRIPPIDDIDGDDLGMVITTVEKPHSC